MICIHCNNKTPRPDFSKVKNFINEETNQIFCSTGCMVSYYKDCRFCRNERNLNHITLKWGEIDENSNKTFKISEQVAVRFCSDVCQAEYEELYDKD